MAIRFILCLTASTRAQVYGAMQKAQNPVVISGDSHSPWAFNLQRIFNDTSKSTYGFDNPEDKVCAIITSPCPSLMLRA
jgi:hypothetical protein